MSRSRQHRRDTADISNPSTPQKRIAPDDYLPFFNEPDLIRFDPLDRRFFRPDNYQETMRARDLAARNSIQEVRREERRLNKRTTYKNRNTTRYSNRVDFLSADDWVRSPRETRTCFKRYVRKQVLHALGRTGKGGKRNKQPRYNADSLTRCRR